VISECWHRARRNNISNSNWIQRPEAHGSVVRELSDREQWCVCTWSETSVGDGEEIALPSRCLDQFPANRMRHGFKPVVRAEFLIDVVEVVTERLRANLELTDDVGRGLPF